MARLELMCLGETAGNYPVLASQPPEVQQKIARASGRIGLSEFDWVFSAPSQQAEGIYTQLAEITGGAEALNE